MSAALFHTVALRDQSDSLYLTSDEEICQFGVCLEVTEDKTETIFDKPRLFTLSGLIVVTGAHGNGSLRQVLFDPASSPCYPHIFSPQPAIKVVKFPYQRVRTKREGCRAPTG